MQELPADHPAYRFAHTGETAYTGFEPNQALFVRVCISQPGQPRCDKGRTTRGNCPRCGGIGHQIRAVRFAEEVKV